MDAATDNQQYYNLKLSNQKILFVLQCDNVIFRDVVCPVPGLLYI